MGWFLLVTISTIGGGIYLRFFSRCSDEEERNNSFFIKDEILAF